MAIVITQVSFKVAFQFGDAPVEEALPTIREAAIEFDLQCAIFTHCIRESVWLSIRIYERVTERVIVKVNASRRKADRLCAIVKEEDWRTGVLQTASRSCARRWIVDKRYKIGEGIQVTADIHN